MDTLDYLRALNARGQKASELALSNSLARFAEIEGTNEQEELRPRRFSVPEAGRFIGVNDSRIRQVLLELEHEGEVLGERRRGNRFLKLSEIERVRSYMFEHFKNPIYHPRRNPETEHLQVISFVNFKGGVGKSTSSLILSEHLATRGYKVLLLDLDAQATATKMLRIFPEGRAVDDNHTIAGFARGKKSAAELIRKSYFDPISIVPASFELQDLEWELISRIRSERGFPFWRPVDDFLRELELSEAGKDLDVVVIDCKPDAGILPVAAIYASTALVIPVVAETPDIESTNDFLAVVADIVESIRPSDRPDAFTFDFIKLLCTRLDRSSPAELDGFSTLRAMYGSAVYDKPVLKTELITAAYADQSLPLADTPRAINQKTYQRGMNSIQEAMLQIENDILIAWGRKPKELDL